MIFNSRAFLFFIIIVYSLFWTIPRSRRRIFLLIASYFFYGFLEPILTLLLLAVTIASFFIAQKIDEAKTQSTRRLFLVFGVILLLCPLIYFKYFNFITGNLNNIIGTSIPLYRIFLPIGISFFTFQVIGYMVDVYRKELKAERNFITFALFKSFFPQLVAGPIERAHHLLPQLTTIKDKTYSSDNFYFGLKITLWGLFKKVVIADRLALFVNPIYNQAANFDGLTLLVATIFFAFQIYCDFSGYSDMAIGIARFFGVDLMKNFNRPYFATSVTDFWRRWHISLSTWFKDYVYIPLGGSKVSNWHWCLNIISVFTISGFWHGAKWTFVIWGLVHGVALIINKFSNIKLPQVINFALTFIFVNLTWVFFRANTVEDAFLIIQKLFTETFSDSAWDTFISQIQSIGFDSNTVIFLTVLIITLLCLENIQKEDLMPKWFLQNNPVLRISFMYSILIAIIYCGYFGKSSFIYFQF